MWSLVDHIPCNQWFGDLCQILLLALPFLTLADLNPGADDGQGCVLSLNRTRTVDLILGQAQRDEILLQFSFDEFATLISASAIDTILSGTSLENSCWESLNTKGGNDPTAPKSKTSGR